MTDLLPLRTRLGVLGGVRGALAVVAVLAPLAVGASPTAQPAALGAAAGLAASAVLFEVGRRARGGLPAWVVGISLLLDGVCLLAATALTGGPTGPLGLLVPIHVVAVTLLASYRTGLKAAMWYSLLLLVAYHAQRGGLLPGPAASRDATVGAVVMLWLVALFTATCSAYNERELRRSRAGFGALAQMTGRLEQVGGATEVADVLLGAVGDHTGFPRAAVLLRVDDQHVEARSWPDGRALVRTSNEAPAASGAVGQCWRSRAPVLATGLDGEGDRVLADLLPGARNLVLVPLTTDDGPLGVLAVERGGRSRSRVPASLVELVGQFAAHAALAHRNASLIEQMRCMAAVDGLTGLANRRTFDEALRTEVHRAARTGEALSLVLLDVDHFKRVNDTFGHQAGDDVLRTVGRVLSAGRATDLPARYGGEEFAVLLPSCGGPDAVAVTERLRAGIAAATGPLSVTVSAGVATFPGDAGGGPALVHAADTALYRAKRSGRNRTERAKASFATVSLG